MVTNVIAIVVFVGILLIKWIGDNVSFETKCDKMESEGAFLPYFMHEKEVFQQVYDDLHKKEFKIVPKEYEAGMYCVKDAMLHFAKAYTQEQAIKSGCRPPWVGSYNKYTFDPWKVWNEEYLPEVLKYVKTEE